MVAKSTKSINEHHGSLWKDEYIYKIHHLAQHEKSNSRVAEILGVTRQMFEYWVKTRPIVAKALADARSADGQVETLQEYIYGHLSPEAQELWDQLQAVENDPTGLDKWQSMLHNRGQGIRQALFFHALVAYSFNASEACRVIGIHNTTLMAWTRQPGFARLIDEFLWHKKNFFESALVKAVQRGETSAIIFANKTLNKDRGYTEKIQLEMTGQVNHTVSIESLNLTLEEKKELLEKVRRARDVKQLTDDTIDAEIVDNDEAVVAYKVDDA